jgi:uncharacterized protein (TIGR00290 family)
VPSAPAVKPDPIDVVLAWSGGKDSALALAALRQDSRYRVVALVTTITGEYDRISIHGVRHAVLEAQVGAIGLPLVVMSIGPAAGNAEYAAAFGQALRAVRARWPGLRHVAFGDLFLQDVRAYREALLASLDCDAVFPLWGADTTALAQRFIGSGYRAIVTCADTTQLAPTFAGREFDASFLADLPATADPCGERGEFHTCVFAGPLFATPLPLVAGERVRREARFEYCDVQLAPVERRGHGFEAERRNTP